MGGDADKVRPAGSGGYVVQPGDGMSSIADANGFFWQTLWEHPGNAALKAARGDPEVLLPGDCVTIPAIRPKEAEGVTGKRHVFRRKGVPAKLRFSVADREGKPFAHRRYQLDVGGGVVFDGFTDPAGKIDRWVPPSTRTARLTVWFDRAGYPPSRTWAVAVGHVDPVGSIAGVQARLNNLGFDCRGEEGLGPKTRGALASFQRSRGLEATGQADDATRDALQARYGA